MARMYPHSLMKKRGSVSKKLNPNDFHFDVNLQKSMADINKEIKDEILVDEEMIQSASDFSDVKFI